jgi:threonine dehydratase
MDDPRHWVRNTQQRGDRPKEIPPHDPIEIYIKPENLQVTGAFKVRGAGNAILKAGHALLQKGVWTASAGNMALGVAWHGRRQGLSCTVFVPEDAPEGKVAAVKQLGATVISIHREDYWNIQKGRSKEVKDEVFYHPGAGNDVREGMFIHPFADQDVMAGNGTIGLEIYEDLPEVDGVIIPYGGGGLSCGIASALRQLDPHIKVVASEVETGAPLAPSLRAGTPVTVPYTKSFVSGMGSPAVFDEMWPLAKNLLDSSLVATLEDTAAAVKMLAESCHLVAEGAGATSVAAARGHPAGSGADSSTSPLAGCRKIVCVVTGGNIDSSLLADILIGKHRA